MNYRHAYHAGNFADVFKHVVLILLTKSFLRKETPFCYLETHAGSGSYDLTSEAAQKTKEFENGIKKIILKNNPPDIIKDYLQCIKKLNSGDELNLYPGSPYFVKHFLRKEDRMILSELHPEEYQALKRNFSYDKNTAIHHLNGYQSLKAFLPPKERRGFILIDPPYEKSDEFETITKVLSEAVCRWETGTLVVWYPIKHPNVVERFLKSVNTKIKRPILVSELSIYSNDVSQRLSGCGMLIINPPWQLEQEIQAVLPWLRQALKIK